MLNILNNEDISVLDRQIDMLIDFKPIPEHEVKLLCEKVHHTFSLKYFIGEGNFVKGNKCLRCKMPGDCVWRYSRTVP